MYGEIEESVFNSKKMREHIGLMEKILDERIFYVREWNGKYYLAENCDDYFSVELTPEICIGLSNFFKDLHDELITKEND